jgi:hypothetical protein
VRRFLLVLFCAADLVLAGCATAALPVPLSVRPVTIRPACRISCERGFLFPLEQIRAEQQLFHCRPGRGPWYQEITIAGETTDDLYWVTALGEHYDKRTVVVAICNTVIARRCSFSDNCGYHPGEPPRGRLVE